MTKRTKYYAHGRKEPLKSGDWVQRQDDVTLNGIFQVEISQDGLLTLVRNNGTSLKRDNLPDTFQHSDKDPEGQRLADYNFMTSSAVIWAIGRAEKQADWYKRELGNLYDVSRQGFPFVS